MPDVFGERLYASDEVRAAADAARAQLKASPDALPLLMPSAYVPSGKVDTANAHQLFVGAFAGAAMGFLLASVLVLLALGVFLVCGFVLSGYLLILLALAWPTFYFGLSIVPMGAGLGAHLATKKARCRSPRASMFVGLLLGAPIAAVIFLFVQDYLFAFAVEHGSTWGWGRWVVKIITLVLGLGLGAAMAWGVEGRFCEACSKYLEPGFKVTFANSSATALVGALLDGDEAAITAAERKPEATEGDRTELQTEVCSCGESCFVDVSCHVSAPSKPGAKASTSSRLVYSGAFKREQLDTLKRLLGA
jgi:hypothetical protein